MVRVDEGNVAILLTIHHHRRLQRLTTSRIDDQLHLDLDLVFLCGIGDVVCCVAVGRIGFCRDGFLDHKVTRAGLVEGQVFGLGYHIALIIRFYQFLKRESAGLIVRCIHR